MFRVKGLSPSCEDRHQGGTTPYRGITPCPEHVLASWDTYLLSALPAQVVGPKKEALKVAEEELEVTMAALRAKQASKLSQSIGWSIGKLVAITKRRFNGPGYCTSVVKYNRWYEDAAGMSSDRLVGLLTS